MNSSKMFEAGVKCKADLLSVYSLAESSTEDGDFARACRYLEIIKGISYTKPQLSDVDWNSKELKDLTSRCTRQLARTYYELKYYRQIIPLLENAIWNGDVTDEQVFIDDSVLLIQAYLQLEEYISADGVASLVQKRLTGCKLESKEDEIQLLQTLIEAFLKGGRSRIETIIPLCDRVLSLTREGDHIEDRVTAFLAKSTATLSTGNAENALVFSNQAVVLTQSDNEVDQLLVAKSKTASVEILIFEEKYAKAMIWLKELDVFVRDDPTLSLPVNKMALARIKYLIGLCSIKLYGVAKAREMCRDQLRKAAKLALAAQTTEEQALLINIWELLAEMDHANPNFVQMEHGHKCILQVLSNGISKLLALAEAHEPVAESLVSVISKCSRLHLELECSLSDSKMAVETVEWVRNTLILAKIPSRRLASKLSCPLTYSWIEQLVARFEETSLFIYFADVGHDSSRAMCTWVFVPGQGCVFFTKSSTASSKSGKSLSQLISNCLFWHSQNNYTSERRLLPSHLIQQSASAATNEDFDTSIAQLAEMLFSKFPPRLWKSVENVFIFPDGQLLALATFFDELVNNWLHVSLPGAVRKKVYSLPSFLFLEICLENQITTLGHEAEHVRTLEASKLGGMFQFFQNEKRLLRERNAGESTVKKTDDGSRTSRPLVRPQSARLAAGAHTIATLTTKTSSGGDVCTSSLYSLASSNDCILPNKAVFFGNPSLPSGVPVGGVLWRPPQLTVSQKEAIQLSKQIHSPYFYLGPQCTKKAFLDCCRDSTLLHLATYVSYCHGIVTFSFDSVEAVSKSSSSRDNVFTPLDISSAKVVPIEIASLPLCRAKLVAISACMSPAEIERTIEVSPNHIGNSVYILPAAFLLAGAHAVAIPRLGLTDQKLVEGFAKIYSKKRFDHEEEDYFCSVIGINSLLDMKRLAHGMLDQEVQQAITKAKQMRSNSDENEVFVDGKSNQNQWFAKTRQLICRLAKISLPEEELNLVRSAIENTPKTNEMSPLPQTPELVMFLKWLGYHVVSLDQQLTALFAPLEISQKLRDKVSLILDVLRDLLYGDVVLSEALVDLMETLTLDQLFDLINFFSVVKHTSFAIEMTDKTAAKLFDNPRIRSFLYLVGFFNVRNSVIFRASAGNCKHFDVAFKLFTALSYSVPNEVVIKFVPVGDQKMTEEPPAPSILSTDGSSNAQQLRSLNYIVAQGPTMAASNHSARRVIAVEPIFHSQTCEKEEVEAKINLANDITAAKKASQKKATAAKAVFSEQLNSFDRIATTMRDREVDKLPNNRHHSDLPLKVKSGATPSQARRPIGYLPPVSASLANEERGKLNGFFAKTKVAIGSDLRQEIEKLIAKYTVK